VLYATETGGASIASFAFDGQGELSKLGVSGNTGGDAPVFLSIDG